MTNHEEKPADRWYQRLAAVIGIATTLLVAFGVSGSLMLRMFRNAPWLVTLAVGALVVGAIWAIRVQGEKAVSFAALRLAALREPKQPEPNNKETEEDKKKREEDEKKRKEDEKKRKEDERKANERFWLSMILFSLGTLGLIRLAASATRATMRPHIDASLDTVSNGMIRVTSIVKADGLEGNAFIRLTSEGALRHPVDSGAAYSADTTPPTVRVHEAVFGPTFDGSVVDTVSFEVSPAVFQDIRIAASRSPGARTADTTACHRAPRAGGPATGEGCVRFVIPAAPIRPALAVAVSPSSGTSARALTANVSAEGVPRTSVIIVRAWAGHAENPFVEQVIGPDRAGTVKGTVAAPIPSAPGRPCLCVVAALVPSPEHASRKAVSRKALCDSTDVIPKAASVFVQREN